MRTVRNSRPPFVKRSGSFDQTSCLWNSRSLPLSSFSSFFLFFSFSFLHFLETGKVKNPPPPNGHARILVNAKIYGRSLKSGPISIATMTKACQKQEPSDRSARFSCPRKLVGLKHGSVYTRAEKTRWGNHGLIQWIPFLMFEILNSCRRKLVCTKIMPHVVKNLSWCALLPNFKKNQKRKLVSSQICSVHFPHLRGQLWGVTTSQTHSFLSIF